MHNFFSYPLFKLDQLNGFVAAGIGVFFVLTLVYSSRFMRGAKNPIQYYSYIILTALAAIGAVLSNNLVLLLVFWGFLGLTLYLLINMGDDSAPFIAKKALIIVGGSDALMLLGIGIIYSFSQTVQIDQINLVLGHWLLSFAYICIAVACFAKAGAMPFHSWIPGCARHAPIPVTAFLPASLDKLLGIYLLCRLSLNLFVMNSAMNNFLMVIGAFTIIAGVMMALVQHNMKSLLGYHAVSQVGYMVLGIGTGNPIGIAGGLFHMLNHALYKSCLFLSAGNVEYRAKRSGLDELGGLSKLMPITYICCMIASFSISGIPPFNGFVSKWMIYQGLIIGIQEAPCRAQSLFTVFCLLAAMFGSGLTLASFMKLLHAVFLGQRLDTQKSKEIKEVSPAMWIPPAVLAAACVIFGVFAFALPLKYFILPALSADSSIFSFPGAWSPVAASALVILGLLLGIVIFKSSKLKLRLRQDAAFSGGEMEEQKEGSMVSGVDFYNTIADMKFLRAIYKKARAGVFDIYEQAKGILPVTKVFQRLHNGVLPTYLVWILLGMIGLFLVLVR